MFKALYYKEFIKSKKLIFVINILSVILLCYVFLKLNRAFRVAGADHVWGVIISKNQFVFRDLLYFPLLSGIALGISQFVPELINKKLKLSLHLPVNEHKTIFYILSFGQLVLFISFLIQILCVICFSYFMFPKEIVISTLITLIPVYISGLLVHSFIGWICVEPSWRNRLINLIISIFLINVYYQTNLPSAYVYRLDLLLIIYMIGLTYIFISAKRFKIGIN
ncbi:MAG: hypothetical protein N4A49_15010 [Marinifilaceae bacterium]|jgi:hypothetical protein|nr:hypothetical protein [Marinifilaceae bacterium]